MTNSFSDYGPSLAHSANIVEKYYHHRSHYIIINGRAFKILVSLSMSGHIHT